MKMKSMFIAAIAGCALMIGSLESQANLIPSLTDTPGGNWSSFVNFFDSTDMTGATAGSPAGALGGFGFDSIRNGTVSGFAGSMSSETTIIEEPNVFFDNKYLELNHYYDFGTSLGTDAITFSGNISNLVLPGTLPDGGLVQVFVKHFLPGFSGLDAATVFQNISADGGFSITTTGNASAGPSQVGFLILDHANVQGNAATVAPADPNFRAGLGLTPASFDFDSLDAVVVPEPSTMALVGLGVASLLIARRRHRS
jgi:hypothetical protein